MTINYTTLLGLTEPVTGTQSGTWGSDINTGLTDYVEAAIAGAQVISGSQTAVTLSVTTGSSSAPTTLSQAGSGATGSSQYQIIRCTGNPAGLLTITAPASDKTYVILNATSTSQSVKIVGAGPTTGVTIVSGERAFVAWNGSDFVKVGGAAGGSNTQVQYNNNGVFGGVSGATTDGTTLSMTSPKVITGINDTNGAELLKVTATASAVNELTLANAATGNAPTLSATGDDTNIGITLTPKGTGTLFTAGNVSFDGGTFVFNESGADKDFRIEGDTDANLFFTDASTDRVGIGTSSPAYKLDVIGSSRIQSSSGYNFFFQTSATTARINYLNDAFSANISAAYRATDFSWQKGDGSEILKLDSSGNLGLGVTPSGWASTYRAYQVGQAGSLFGLTNDQDRVGVSSNAYFDTTDGRWEYIGTGYAMRYDQNAGEHQWYTAASGAANGAITFTQAMTLDASGNLGIGTTSPAYNLDVNANTNSSLARIHVKNTNSGNTASSVFSLGNDGGNGQAALLLSSSTNATFGANALVLTNAVSTGTLQFWTNNTERARITSGGVLDLATGAGAVGQIQFPATQVASSNANTLDDYEEGEANVTYSPESSGTITVDTNNDRIAYTKIGRQVTITGQVNISAVSSPAGGYVHVNGLPFASADLTESAGRIGGAVTFYDDSTNSYTARGVLMVEGGTQARLYIDASTVAASDGFVFSFSYFTT